MYEPLEYREESPIRVYTQYLVILNWGAGNALRVYWSE